MFGNYFLNFGPQQFTKEFLWALTVRLGFSRESFGNYFLNLGPLGFSRKFLCAIRFRFGFYRRNFDNYYSLVKLGP